MKSNILIIGSGYEQIDLIKKAKQLNFFVISSDINPNAPGKIYSDKFFIYSTDDKLNNLKIAKKYKVKTVLTSCSELALKTVAYINSKLKLKGLQIDQVSIATNKLLMKNFFGINKISTTDFISTDKLTEVNTFIDKSNFPIVLKPEESSGQKGIYLLNSKRSLKAKFLSAIEFSDTKRVILEKFAKGKEINVIAIVINKKLKILSISERLKPNNEKYFGIATMHIYPSKLSKKQTELIKSETLKLAKSLGLKYAILYPQFIINYKSINLLEFALRIPGGFMSEIALNSSGVNLNEFLIKSYTYKNLQFSSLNKYKKYKSTCVNFITSLDLPKLINKRIKNIDLPKKERNVVIKLNVKKNSLVPQLSNSTGRIGAIIVTDNNIDKAYIISKKIKKNIDYIIS